MRNTGSISDCQEEQEDAHIGYDKWGFVDESGKHTGYFYISYYDKTLGGCESMTYSTDLASSGEGFSTWMYDYMPALVKLDMDTTVQSSSLTKTANVFTNDEGFDVGLRAVSTKTAQPNATVKYSIYRLAGNPANPEDGTLLAELSATYEYKGFHRESLKDDITVKNGETIAVVAEETVDDATEGKLYEYAVNATGTQERVASTGEPYYGVAVVNKGESFIYEDGAWTDWTEYGKRAELGGQFAIDNFSVKAYVVAGSAPAEKAENPMTVKGKKVTASASKKSTFKKAQAFKVSNAEGKVIFKKAKGNAKITVGKAGKVTVKKGLKAGKTYKVKVKVTAAGNANYKKATKAAAVKVKVK